ncbi:MAG: polysaccharide pyruvyl transferase CsaB [Clostridia bacterium]|nr:polysaccharide pyruvyl transferase CsaB [Clostridia bacterium]
MSRVLISGYYGFNNAGDEAVLFSIVSTLKQLKPDVEIVVLSNDPAKTTSQHSVKAVNRWKIPEILLAVQKCDLLISGGGSLLQDVTGAKSVVYYLGIVRLAKLLGKPVMFYANGVGPVTKPLTKMLINLIGNKVDTITVRDEQSLNDLREMGVNKPMARISADPALGINREVIDLNHGRELLKNLGLEVHEGKPILGICVREWEGLTEYTTKIGRVADGLAAQGWQVVLLPMHHPKDVEPSRRVAKVMTSPAIVVEEEYHVKDTLAMIGNLDFLLGMRLHALVMASVMHVPFLGISYDPKVDRFLELIGLEGAGAVQNLDEEILREKLAEKMCKRSELREYLRTRMTELSERARESAILALSLLK